MLVGWLFLRRSVVIAYAVALLVLAPVLQLGATPHGFDLVDQECVEFDSPWVAFLPILSFAPVGQEFTPELTSLNVVHLHTIDLGESAGAELLLNIREGTIYGPIVGASALLSLPDAHYGVTEFTFEPEVAVTPGAVHVIEVVQIAGDSWGCRFDGDAAVDFCPGMRMIRAGEPVAELDLWFREGIGAISPVQSTSWSVIKGRYQ